MSHYNIDITGINERADKLTLESEVKQLYDHAVEVLNWIINERADKLTLWSLM